MPTRLVARQVSELLSARGRRWGALLGVGPLTAFIHAVIISAGMQHLPYRRDDGEWLPIGGAGVGAEARERLARPVSGSAIAHSMGIPLTTVRRHAADLVAAGLVERHARGFVVTDAFRRDPRLLAFAEADVADLSRMIEALAQAGYAPARSWSPWVFDIVPAGVVERAIQTFALRVLETFTTNYDGFLPGGIVAAIVAANVRAITADPGLAARYGTDDSPPPDDLRKPVSVRALAQELDIPFETVRRRVAALEEAGVVLRGARGVIVPGRMLRTPEHLANNRRITAHFDQLLGTLAALARPAARVA
ncbi:MAG: ArsR family transcriptional regulator [Sphingomonas adhaesiva]|uniref:ArsR family transcriptional regulator n=1 Tax=Sphingomonas adhaesiva TaxID=28212 RepID=UPI002FFBA1F9